MKRTILAFFLTLLHISLCAQQWEFDYSNGESYIVYENGILDTEGNGILVGGCGPTYSDCHPVVMRVESDGTHFKREYDSLGGLMLTDVVQLCNGNYLAAGEISGEAIGVMVLDQELEVVKTRRYEKIETAFAVLGGRLLLDRDGTVVMSGKARYPLQNGVSPSYPYLYRFDENGDTLRCHFVMPEYPDPEYFMEQYDCHQILMNPSDDGLIIVGTGWNGLPSLITYDRDFNFVSNVWMENDSVLLFSSYSSSCWLSNEDLLVFGTLTPTVHSRRSIGLLDVKLSGGVRRIDRICEDAVLSQIASGACYCTAFVNDTTIYGSYYSTEDVYVGPYFPSACLFDKDMEVLGSRVFLDEKYTNQKPFFILPQDDGGCIMVTLFIETLVKTHGKVMKLSREDFNPVPVGVKQVPQEELQGRVYPNPASDEIHFDISNLPNPVCGEHRISIHDVAGHIIMSRIIRGEGNVLTVGVGSLPAGVYAYRIYNAEREIQKGKFVKE